jgi:hypothetical protein
MNLAHIVLGFDWLVLFLPTLIAAPNLAVSRRLTARLLASFASFDLLPSTSQAGRQFSGLTHPPSCAAKRMSLAT